jgi:tetratricopeptide (TPR) repeat protein
LRNSVDLSLEINLKFAIISRKAEEAAAKAVELALSGNFRFFGDIGGGLTEIKLPALYAMLAEVRRDLGRYAEALADIKAARSMTKETRPDHAGIEASIWAVLGAYAKAEACWLEARGLGHKDAEKALRAIYEKGRGTAEGFDEYLAEKAKTGTIVYFLTGGSPGRHEQLAPLIDNLLL